MRSRYRLDVDDALEPAYLSEDYVSADQSTSTVDQSKVDGLLSGLGLNDSDIEILKLHLEGLTYVEMAERLGGSPDKYRKKVKRAKEKADLQEFSFD